MKYDQNNLKWQKRPNSWIHGKIKNFHKTKVNIVYNITKEKMSKNTFLIKHANYDIKHVKIQFININMSNIKYIQQ